MMKRKSLGSVATILILLCLAACLPQTPERASELAFKGMELYSWQAESGGWQFSLMPGTNRIKTITEVVEDPLDQPTLEAAISQLAAGETIFWVTRADGEGETHLDFPPQDVIDAIIRHTDEVNVQVEIVRP